MDAKKTLFIGVLSVAALGVLEAATLAHRYSFDGDTSDSAGGVTGVLNNGATVSGGSLVLPGGGSALTAPHMGFSSTIGLGTNFGATGFTLETWYTDTGSGGWAKVYHFGTNTAGQEVAFTNYRPGDAAPGLDRDGAKFLSSYPMGSTTRPALNTEHHLVVSVASDGTTNLWLDGTLEINNIPTNAPTNIVSTTEAIGATSWGDPGHQGSVNEFRIWEGTLAPAEVQGSLALGPDTLIPEPTAVALCAGLGLALIFRRRKRRAA